MPTNIAAASAAELLLSSYKSTHEARIGRLYLSDEGNAKKDNLTQADVASYYDYVVELESDAKASAAQYREWCKTATMDDKRIVMRYISTKTHLLGSTMEAYLNIN